MLTFIIIFFQCINDGCQVLLIAQEICMAGIDDNGLKVMLLNVVRIGLLDIKEIFIWNILLIGSLSFPDIVLQLVNRGV